jgi:ATP-dependent RNA helicase RhlE
VINFDIPDTVDAYTHRIGRTGRAHQSGEAFTFAGQADEQMIRDIEKLLGTQIERRRLPDFNYGSFVPESQFQENHSKLPRKTLAHHKRNHSRSNKGRNSARRRPQRRR